MRNRAMRVLCLLVLIVLLFSACSSKGGLEVAENNLSSIGNSSQEFLDSDDFCQENLDQVIKELTSERYAGRRAGTEGNKLAMEYIIDRFKVLGLEPAGEDDTYQQVVNPGFTSEPDDEKNVIACLQGNDSELPPIIFSAHYDHQGIINNEMYPGALDNASGVAFILELARVLTKVEEIDRDIYFIAFDSEEAGIIGSDYFVKNPTFDIQEAECLNFDMIGSANESVALYLLYSSLEKQLANEIREYSELVDSNISVYPSDRSDHRPFCDAGIAAVSFIYYDTENYHKPSDTFENMDTGNTEDVFILVKEYLASRGIIIDSEFRLNE